MRCDCLAANEFGVTGLNFLVNSYSTRKETRRHDVHVVLLTGVHFLIPVRARN